LNTLKTSRLSRERGIIYSARIISAIFNPFYLALVGLVLVFTFSYLNMLPLVFRLQVLALVFFFTILMPTVFIRLYRYSNGWTLLELGRKHRRIVPYVISIVCYLACYWLIDRVNIFHIVATILMSALLIQIVCAFINIGWKISTHTAAIGGVAGSLIAFAEKFSFNPVWWLCLVLILAGVLGSARMILRQHSLSQVLVGFTVGCICAFIGVTFF
jgi:membrane-associated phospholipid phosphatase